MQVVKNPITGSWELAESGGTIPRAAGEVQPCDPLRVLLVDDEAQARKLYSLIIGQTFPSVTCDLAENGARAVELFIEHHPLVIVMDIVMPVLDGEKAFYQIEEHCQANQWQSPRVIFCTGYSPSIGLRNVVASDSAHCLLQKPIRKQVLVTAISKRLPLPPTP